ncbi:MarR family winged helix-turn-helix transcriptional regulator [Candidatus Viridilinea mediisalina]|uniref:MarR family transcriptional regulator n=1 Tax=Candidatus Viridilinea mediisalina TaxID=2024553 RepID=A0A2A6RP55_9CHLR|nr:MarR family transcriptional regulator [Candidatus Viridilinea mediisalina]PDW04658.1 MarR family transcriptional regulator [Candidatus Viridilinea mediisalina]
MTQRHHDETLHNERTALEEIERSIMQISWLAQRQFMQLLDDERFRLTLPQFYTLLHLEQTGTACKMSDLAEATHQSAASLTGVVDRLRDKQLIERLRDERDRRQVMVVVTTQGRELIGEIKQARHDQMQMALAHLDDPEIDALMILLDRVLAGMVRTLERAESGRLA